MSIGIPLDPESSDEIGRNLQVLVVDLLALSLTGKQAHWHVTGRHFVPVHEQLDAVVDSAREYADLVAERSVTLGVPVDGRPSTVAASHQLGDVSEGWLPEEKAVLAVADEIEGIVARTRAPLHRLGELDPVTQDLVIGVLTGLEKHLWMLQAQLA